VAPTSLIIADDHPLFRAALKEAVSHHIPGAQIVEASSLETLQRAVGDHPDADLVLLDLKMPGAKGFSALLYVRAEHPALPVIVVSASEDASVVQRSLDFGASGFIPKSASIESIGQSLRTVLEGGVCSPPVPESQPRAILRDSELARRLSSLTPRQLGVLVMLAEGQSNRRIAENLAITEATVKAHITGILRKLGTESRTEAAVLAQRLLQTGDNNIDLNGIEEE
jgi:DNA-binding NarL/FixJ family response regulator